MNQQLPLPFVQRADMTFSSFHGEANQELIQLLQQIVVSKSDPFVFLYGPGGSGRTHLLQACCQAIWTEQSPVMYLSLRDYATMSPQVFDGLESMRLIAIDDIDCVTQDAVWAEALFHLYNRVRDTGSQLVASATQLLDRQTCVLPDLESRLTWGFVYRIRALSDDDKHVILRERCYDKGLVLSDEVARYLLHRLPRELSVLLSVVDQLDQASWQSQRRLTIPFVKGVLNQASIDIVC